MNFSPDTEFPYGELQQLTPLIRRIIAPNPGPFTGPGTGTYVVGHGQVAVIDPGPLDQEHIKRLLAGLAGETVSHILITHTHIDHSPGAGPLQRATGAPTYGFGRHGELTGGALGGGDAEFTPDIRLRTGESVSGADWSLEAMHTPGHCSNHLCYALAQEKALFAGDQVMGWSTTVISPPDGNMTQYMAALAGMKQRTDTGLDSIYWPTHGAAIRDPGGRLAELIEHRERRRSRILERMAAGDETIPAIVKAIYILPHKSLVPAAARSVLSQMLELIEEGVVEVDGTPTVEARYRLK